MPDNNPKNSVGGGWHLTHNIIQQIYSYSANSGKKFDEVQRNPNVSCVDNQLIYQSTFKVNGKSEEVNTGILFDNMMDYLLSKPRNINDNSYNTKIQVGQKIEEDDSLQVSLKEVDLPSRKNKNKNNKGRQSREKEY
jgi:hypothetical protein